MISPDMFKYSIITLEEVHSTNGYALENIASFEDKAVIFTPHQTSGRGRYNRKWIGDASENIYMSVILKPHNISNFPISNLTQYLSVIVCEFLEKEFDLLPSIKWPNDILIDGCKISGILAETYMDNNEIKGIVLGLGLNVNLPAETLNKIDQKATSLYVIKNKTFDVENILRKILDLFFENYEKFISKGFTYIKNEYEKRCNFLGNKITIRETGIQYTAISINNDGLLVVNDKTGKKYEIMTGDILC